MNHDVRVLKMNARHKATQAITCWLGISIGSWTDRVLEEDTTHFITNPPLAGADENLYVVKHFRPSVEDKIFGYACHEWNYAFGNIMRGARLLERDAM